jgi:hypothetical protein
MSRSGFGACCLIGSLAGMCLVACMRAADKPTAAKVDFNRDIRPIFSNHCYACHGPDGNKRKAGLRLDRKEDAFQELDSGEFALVPGDPAESELYRRITEPDAARRMPPQKTGNPLSPTQVELIRRWIEEGARWKKHWAYIPPERPALPAVRDPAWCRNGIDYFILDRLEREGLHPSPEADRATLIRRVNFDLTGLPPTPAEVDAFLADAGPGAYEKVVDRLLASPHFGERMAQHWLDLARYADTNGYHIDNQRDMWKWREWVVNAFNANKPFDVFTVEQLAGDLLPNATLEQRVASGFHRNVMVNFEGGADPEEYLTEYVRDRVTTTATVWLGTTLACTECHDHKYDPFTQKEFYRLYAFFNNVPEQGLDGQKENPVPSLRVPNVRQAARLEALRRQRADLEARLRAEAGRVRIETPAARPPREAREYLWLADALPPGATPQGNEGEGSWKWVEAPCGPRRTLAQVVKQYLTFGRNRAAGPSGDRRLKASVRTAQGLSQHFFTGANPGMAIRPGDKLFAYVYVDPKDPPRTVMLQFNDGKWEHRAYWGANAIDWGADGTSARFYMGPLPPAGRWVRLEVSPRAVGLAPGTVLNGLAFTQVDGTVYWNRAGVLTHYAQDATAFDDPAEWEEYARFARGAGLPDAVAAALRTDPTQRTDAQRGELRAYFVEHVYSKSRPLFEPRLQEAGRLRKAEADLTNSLPATMVMQEMPKPRDTFVLIRGDFQRHGAKVNPGVPAVLPPLPRGARNDRLGLAKWLVLPDHPLTARVTVNRYWEQLFGTGIVKTGEDFGSQGEWPSHPELLDWLATEFVARKWDVKAILRLMVTSAAYRQAARVTPDLGHRDPDNRLLARGPRFRLPAEMVRDNALAVSGLLDHRLGGPSVRPYQPGGLWEQVAFGGGFSAQTYVQSHGRDLYRRGLYTFWKRSLPHPSLIAFDAPNREVCTDRRPRTNTPLQALVLFNDPIYVECARLLGQRVLREGGADTGTRLVYAFRLCTARLPRPEELEVLLRVYAGQRARFARDPAAARRLVRVGESPRPPDLDVVELATWTAVGNMLLTLDETITKG